MLESMTWCRIVHNGLTVDIWIRPKVQKEVNTWKPEYTFLGNALCSWGKDMPGKFEGWLLEIVSDPATHSKIK